MMTQTSIMCKACVKLLLNVFFGMFIVPLVSTSGFENEAFQCAQDNSLQAVYLLESGNRLIW